MQGSERIAAATITALGLTVGPAFAAGVYPNMAPAADYQMASSDAEIALARTAAPASISADADILVLGAHDYETAVKGKNGYACLVYRAWTAGFDDPVFWNPHVRGPACLNAAAVRSVLPHIHERAQWVLSGVSKAQMEDRTRAEIATHSYLMPEEGAMSFMMSKGQYLSDDGSHNWHPHVMFYVSDPHGADWGVNVKGSPVIAAPMAPEPVTILMIPVAKWSDGSAQAMEMK